MVNNFKEEIKLAYEMIVETNRLGKKASNFCLSIFSTRKYCLIFLSLFN